MAAKNLQFAMNQVKKIVLLFCDFIISIGFDFHLIQTYNFTQQQQQTNNFKKYFFPQRLIS